MVNKNLATLTVKKVPLARRPIDLPAEFPDITNVLYLELLENKEKIKPSLVNKPFTATTKPKPVISRREPSSSSSTTRVETSISEDEQSSTDAPRSSRRIRKGYETEDSSSNRVDGSSSSSRDRSSSDETSVDRSRGDDEKNDRGDDERRGDDEKNERSERRGERRGDDEKNERSERRGDERRVFDRSERVFDRSERVFDRSDRRPYNDERDERSSPSSSYSSHRIVDEVNLPNPTKPIVASTPEEDVEDKLLHLLAGKESMPRAGAPKEEFNFRRMASPNLVNPPTLDELRARGEYVQRQEVPDISRPTLDDFQTADKKREILFQFELLKRKNAGITIPEMSQHTDLQVMQKELDLLRRRATMETNVANYKQYLIASFFATEFLCGKYLGFEMKGFANQQLTKMSAYEEILFEIGEKNYVPSGSSWSPEMRLFFMILTNAVVFIITQMVVKHGGEALINMMYNTTSKGTAQAPAQAPAQRKMTGPKISLDDIPELGKVA